MVTVVMSEKDAVALLKVPSLPKPILRTIISALRSDQVEVEAVKKPRKKRETKKKEEVKQEYESQENDDEYF
jgi:hypothetical protein